MGINRWGWRNHCKSTSSSLIGRVEITKAWIVSSWKRSVQQIQKRSTKERLKNAWKKIRSVKFQSVKSLNQMNTWILVDLPNEKSHYYVSECYMKSVKKVRIGPKLLWIIFFCCQTLIFSYAKVKIRIVILLISIQLF